MRERSPCKKMDCDQLQGGESINADREIGNSMNHIALRVNLNLLANAGGW
jgi:hypothetical protein